jgi:large subunit ribosomal protein L10
MAERLKSADALVVADYRGLTDAELKLLRGELRKSGAEMRVIKNTLAKRAFEMAGLEAPDMLLSGPTAIALFFEDLSTPAKAMLEFARKHEHLQMKGGMLEGTIFGSSGVSTLSELPTKDEVRSMIVGVLQAPTRQLVTVLQAPMRDLVSVIRNYAEKSDAAD